MEAGENSIIGAECLECVQGRLERLLDLYDAQGQERAQCRAALEGTFASLGPTAFPPELLREAYRAVAEQFTTPGALWPIKQQMNDHALELLSLLKMRLRVSGAGFQLATRFVLAGLQVDFLRDSHARMLAQIDSVSRGRLAADHSRALERACGPHRRVLYIGGQAGGIMLDRLLIQQMGSQEITYAINGTRYAGLAVCGQDAAYADMRSQATVLETGCGAPVPLLPYASERFRQAYQQAHTIVVVGQTALESLIPQYDPRLYVLLHARCPCAATRLHLPQGVPAVLNLSRWLKAHATRSAEGSSKPTAP